jgi:hypothetical protein
MPASEIEALARLRMRYGWLRIVRLDRSAYDATAPERTDSSGQHILWVSRSRPFAPIWEASVGTGTRRVSDDAIWAGGLAQERAATMGVIA